jgi:hypothetical protein
LQYCPFPDAALLPWLVTETVMSSTVQATLDHLVPRRITIEDVDVSRLAQIVKIPASRIPSFSWRLRIVFLSTQFLFPKTSFDSEIAELDHLERAARAFLKALHALGDASQGRMEYYFEDLGAYMGATELILQAASSAHNALSIKENRGPGRRSRLPGGRGMTALDAVTWSVLELVDQLGGRLTLDRRGETGTLIDFLQKIRDYVPPACIPDPLPLARLDQLKRHLSKMRSARR